MTDTWYTAHLRQWNLTHTLRQTLGTLHITDSGIWHRLKVRHVVHCTSKTVESDTCSKTDTWYTAHQRQWNLTHTKRQTLGTLHIKDSGIWHRLLDRHVVHCTSQTVESDTYSKTHTWYTAHHRQWNLTHTLRQTRGTLHITHSGIWHIF